MPEEKGNNPELWNKLIRDLDEKMQFGLISALKEVDSYHFEGDTLYLTPGSEKNVEVLSKDTNLNQLKIYLETSIGFKNLEITTK